MSKSLNSPSGGGVIVDTFKKRKGGTEATSVPNADTSLDLVTSSDFNIANGVLALDSKCKIPLANLPNSGLAHVALFGPTSFVVGQVVSPTITNFDSFTDYTYSATGSRVTINANTFRFNVGVVPGNYTFTINDKTYNYTIETARPNAPTLTVVDSLGATGLAMATMTTSAFSMLGITDTHKNTDWQISTVSDFSTTVYSSLANASNLLTVSYNALGLNTSYYARVRHRSVKDFVSPWVVTTFKTKAQYIPRVEYSKITNINTVGGDYFGFRSRLSNNGDRLVTGAYLNNADSVNDKGVAYVYFRDGLTWTQEARLVASDGVASGQFGEVVTINGAGDRIAIAAPGMNSNQGKVYIFLRTGTSWAQEAMVTASDGAAGARFGTSIAFDLTAARLIVGAPNMTSATFANAGKTYVYSRSGVAWSQEAIITASDQAAGNLFGCSVSLDTTGARCIIGAKGKTNNSGGIYIFLRSGVAWAVESNFINGTNANYQFGACVNMRLAGDYAVVGCPGYFSSQAGQGAAFLLSRTGVTWTIRYTALASDPQAGAALGTSVSIDSTSLKIVAGAPNINGNAGAAYIFTATTTGWTVASSFKITASDLPNGPNQYFGLDTAMSYDGTKISIGAYGDASNKGALYQMTS
jgi:hypothetical protein